MVYITQSNLDRLNAGTKPQKQTKNKYNAKKVLIDGIWFDSKKEGARYQELKLQEHCGLISDLKLQPKFILQEGFNIQDYKVGPITYKADFQYEKGGEIVVEDTKGFKTRDYILKKKLFLKKFPEYRFLES